MKAFDNNKGFDMPELQEEKNILGKWAAFFIDRYRILILIVAAVLIWGIGAYSQMSRELEPEVIFPFGHVMTIYNGAAPEEVEKLITQKIEKKLDELEDVKQISSSSGYGYSSIFVEFEQGVDMDNMLQKMRDKVSAVQSDLPEEAEIPQVESMETNNSPIMVINLSGDYDFVTLKNMAENIEDEIERMNEISDVQIIGGLEREIKIIVDPQKLAVYSLSLDQIKNAIAGSNVSLPGGDIELDNKNYNIRTVGEFGSPKELENVIVAHMGGSPLFLRDVAQVEDGYADAESYSRTASGLDTEKPSMKKSVAISVKKKKEADVIKTSAKIHTLIEQGKGTLYPENLQVEVSGDLAVYVKDELGAVIDNAISGLLLVIIVLFLFIGFSESIIVSFVIPLSILIAFGLMQTFHMTFNQITLFSLILAVGMLVDNGIVIMENIDRLRLMGLSSKTAAEVGVNQIAPAVMSSTLTTLAAFFPLALTPGIMGAWIKPIPLTVGFALSASFVVAITITPALCSIVLKQRKLGKIVKKHPIAEIIRKIASVLLVFILSLYAFKSNEGGFYGFGTLSLIFGIIFAGSMAVKQFGKKKDHKDRFIIRTYGERLYNIVCSRTKRWMVVSIALVAFLASMALPILGILKVEMFSPEDETRLYIDIETPVGTSLETTAKVTEEVEKRLFGYPEIKSFISNVGITGADSLTEEVSVSGGGTPNIARIAIDLYDADDRERTSIELVEILREKIKNIPGGDIRISQVEDVPSSGRPVTINIKGENLENLKTVAADYLEILKEIKGTRDASSDVESGSPELQIRVNKERAALFGLDDITVAMGVRNAIHGLKATTFRNNQDEIDVIIRTTKEKLKNVEDLEKIYFTSRSGQTVAFSQVAEIVETKSVTAIRHEDLKRFVSISSDIDADVTAIEIVNQFKQKVKAYPLPDDIAIQYGGEQEDVEESFGDMLRNMAVAAILVYLILAIQFNSLSQPMIILIAVPMAMIGVMPGLLITGNTFGFVSFVGIVALVGIAVNDAIVLVDYINYLRKNGYDIKDAVKETGMTRFMPVMATTITTAGGILPISLKQPFFAPMGYALIFGLSVATMLTLVVVPVLYTILEERKVNKQMKKNKGTQLEGGHENEENSHVIISY
ncbi:MAG: efflux RND transporter permease subunit [Bacillota bacterium]